MEEAFSLLLDKGVLGIMVVLLILSNVYQYKRNQSLVEKNNSDVLQLSNKFIETAKDLSYGFQQLKDSFLALKDIVKENRR